MVRLNDKQTDVEKTLDARQLMGEAKFYEAYSRWNETTDKFETWEEAVDRVMKMHFSWLKHKGTLPNDLLPLLHEVAEAYKSKQILGAQRALQFGGDQLMKHQSRMYNCASSYCDRSEFFGEAFYLMLCGCGTGFSVQKQHITKLPSIVKRTKSVKTFVIPDTIEGWANSIDVLLSSFFENNSKHPEFKGHKVYFDFSKIRPKGSFISGGFKAPGSEALQHALTKTELLIKQEIEAGYTTMRPIVAYDIVMFIADAVISGGKQ